MANYDTTEFKRRMARVPAKVRDAVNAAIEKDAAEWVALAKQAVPRDPKDGTPLADSIRNYRTSTGGQVVRAGGETTTKDGYDYALANEFGTQKMSAQPFFWFSYRLIKKRFRPRRSRALNKAIKEINNGG